MAGGRPSVYTPELAAKICDEMSNGRSLHKICRDEGMPHRLTVLRWCREKEDFRNQYAQAREALADFLAEEILEIIDDKSQDILDIPNGGDSRMITNSAAVQRAKLQFEGRKWSAAQMAPKKWGQQSVQLTGENGGPPVFKHVVEIVGGGSGEGSSD